MVTIVSTSFDEDGTETRTVRDYPGMALVIGDSPGEPLRLVPVDDFPCCSSPVKTTDVGDVTKVELGDLANYGNVSPHPHQPDRFRWSLASGQSGEADSRQAAVDAAVRALRHSKGD